MRLRVTVTQWALFAVFFLIPIALTSFGPRYVPLNAGVWFGLLVISILTATPAAVFFVLALGSNIRRLGRSVSAAYIRRENQYTAWAAVFLALTITGALATSYTPLAPVYAALVVAYGLIVLPTSARHLEYRAAIVVRCTPEEAYDFVTDPRNVSRYHPNLGLAAPVDLPLRVGSIIRYTVRERSLAVEASETVVDLEPIRRFATQVASGSQGIYTIAPVEGGTEIAYVSTTLMSVSSALFGGTINRRHLRELLLSRRLESLRRLKDILEARPLVPV